jgi:hypothetical protein
MVNMKIQYLLFLLIALLIGCSTIELKSYWRDQEIKIDGESNEWEGKTWMLEDIKNVQFGFINDQDFLYLLLATSDRALQRQIAFRGLTIWFDREGGNEKRFGIHYPMPMMKFESMGQRMTRTENERGRDTTFSFPEKFSDELDIYGPMENEHSRLRMQETGGIEIALHNSQGLLVYEMKVPLTDKGPQPYVVGALAGSIIGIGVETMSDEFGGRPSERSMGGDVMGGGFGGRRGFGPPGGRHEMNKPLKLWAKLELAASNSK